jgi:hypothetical protein
LTHLLKSFDYWEGKGRGLSSLIDTCLDNKIDLPYYILTDGEIKLFIPTGKVFDEAMESWLNSFNGYILEKNKRELNEDEKIILSFFYKSEMLNRVESYTILLTMDNNHKEVIANLEEKGLIFKDYASPEIYPIYRVDRTLVINEVSDILQNIFGKEWTLLKIEHKEVLQAIYWYSHYAIHTELLSANSVGKIIYTKNNKNFINLNDLKDYENFKRKIRNIFNQLESKNFIVRKDGKTKENGGKPDFVINENFSKTKNLFLN